MKLLTLIFLAVLSSADPYPGVRTSVSLNALNSVLQAALPTIITDVSQMEIPAVTFDLRFLLLPIKLKISDFNIMELNMNVMQSNVGVNNQTQQLYLTFSSFNIFMQADYAFPLLGIKGDFNLSLSNSTVIIPFKLGINEFGEVSSSALPLIGNLSSLEFEFVPNGWISTSFMVVSHLWPLSKLTNHVIVNLFDSISSLLNPKIEDYFNSIRYTDQIGTFPIAADYHFYSLELNPTDVVCQLNGTFFLPNSLSTVSPVTPPTYLPDFVSTSSVKIQLTEYFFDSMMWSLYASDSLSIYVASSDIPPVFPYPFTTTGLTPLVPGLAKTYGPNLPVDLDCSLYQIPIIDIETNILVTTGVSCNFIVNVTPAISVTAFTLIAQFSTQFLASIVNQDDGIYLIASLDQTYTQFSNFSIINSNVGIFNTAALAKAINWYTYHAILQADAILENQGVRLPFPKGIQLQNPVFNLYPGAVEIGFEPIFTS